MFGIYICDLSIIFMRLLIFEKYSYFLIFFCDFSIYYFRSLYIFFEDYCTKVWEISILIIGEHWRLGSLYIFKRLLLFRISKFFRSLLLFRISLYYLRDYLWSDSLYIFKEITDVKVIFLGSLCIFLDISWCSASLYIFWGGEYTNVWDLSFFFRILPMFIFTVRYLFNS